MAVLNPISFVTGPLGSGKSYFAQRHILQYLADGKYVATNYDLVGAWWETARWRSSRGRKLKGRAAYEWSCDCRARGLRFDVMDDLYDFELPGSGEDRGLLVLDEGGLNMNSRLYQLRQKRDKELHDNPIKSLQFYINMRKLGWTCLILAHSAEHVDNQVQSMGGGVIKLRNFARVKMPMVGVALAKNPRFLARYFTPDISGTIPEHREMYGLNKRIASHYRSMERFEFMPESRGVRCHVAPGPLGRAADGLGERIAGVRGGAAGPSGAAGDGASAAELRYRGLRRFVRRVLRVRVARGVG